ncbi:antibiotic biosynthesis monooxygenase [Paracoccus spongiarum]|uniref:Antibiotic biosynthesis monooxygenase n=1 Tax=Paracoccus spongiarum TaxID=3064387 RepID=A0ABT9JG52_9RHOB|nr:antibiotic biosynthesis monooxygenase [Paracoccus sp. 2205BS29-5]MDP5308756.1 antibiotic biosynthesis monooxygenase [Paracoccus sp. 2205BS29-5]
MLIQLVSIQVLPGHRDRFIEAFRINWEGARTEPRNLRFDLLCDPDDENSFTVYEIFADLDALKAHGQTAHYRRCIEMITPITTGQRSKRYYQPVLVEPAPPAGRATGPSS